jgi:multiple sugar transport system ATP-binding protein
MTMADRIVVLQAGVIEQVGSPLELYREPRNIFVAGFIGSPKMNLVEGAEAIKYNAKTIGIRPEHIAVSTDPKEGAWQGIVGASEHLGSDTFIHVHDIPGCDPLTVRAGGEVSVTYGDAIYLMPDPAQLHKFDDQGLRIS